MAYANSPELPLNPDEELHTVCWIDSLGLRNCIWPAETIIFLVSRLMSHKSDKVPCCLSILIIKTQTNGAHACS